LKIASAVAISLTTERRPAIDKIVFVFIQKKYFFLPLRLILNNPLRFLGIFRIKDVALLIAAVLCLWRQAI
jgi:hypothetical protein